MELFEGFADNWGNKTSNDTQKLLGRPARGYRQFAAEFKDAFSGAATSQA